MARFPRWLPSSYSGITMHHAALDALARDKSADEDLRKAVRASAEAKHKPDMK